MRKSWTRRTQRRPDQHEPPDPAGQHLLIQLNDAFIERAQLEKTTGTQAT